MYTDAKSNFDQSGGRILIKRYNLLLSSVQQPRCCFISFSQRGETFNCIDNHGRTRGRAEMSEFDRRNSEVDSGTRIRGASSRLPREGAPVFSTTAEF